MWGAAHYFRQSKAILLNQPWSTSTHIMIGARVPGPFVSTDPDEAAELMASKLRRGERPPPLDFLVETGSSTWNTEQIERALGWTPIVSGDGPVRILLPKR